MGCNSSGYILNGRRIIINDSVCECSSGDFHLFLRTVMRIFNFTGYKKNYESLSVPDEMVFPKGVGNSDFTEFSSETLTEVSEVKIFTIVS